MSVRAYRVNKIECENDPSFNVWHHPGVLEYLEDNCDVWEAHTEDSLAYLEVPVKGLQSLIKALRDKSINPVYEELSPKEDQELRKDLIEGFKKDIDWAKKKHEEFVFYHCF